MGMSKLYLDMPKSPDQVLIQAEKSYYLCRYIDGRNDKEHQQVAAALKSLEIALVLLHQQ